MVKRPERIEDAGSRSGRPKGRNENEKGRMNDNRVRLCSFLGMRQSSPAESIFYLKIAPFLFIYFVKLLLQNHNNNIYIFFFCRRTRLSIDRCQQ